jgi:sigma-B regulation protein RsbU (phosphoserine phosphatase)
MWIRRASGQLDEFMPQMPPLGVVASMNDAEPHVTTLQPGDTIVLVSDGTFEAMNEHGELFGIDTLREVVRSLKGQTAAAMRDEIDQAVIAHREGAPISDDATIVVVRRV